MFRNKSVYTLGAFLALILFIALPDFVLVRSDDFGYLQSLILTIQKGRLWTSDFLEPYNCFLSGISWLTYSVTGSMYLSTYGILVLFSLLNFVMLAKLLKSDTFHEHLSTCFAFLISVSPLILYRSFDYSGMTFTLTLLYLALLCYKGKRWAWFYVVVFLSASNRQSAIYLLVLPGIQFLEDFFPNKKINYRLAIYTIVFGLAFLTIGKYMNVSYAQENITKKVMENFNALKFVSTFVKVMAVIVLVIRIFSLPNAEERKFRVSAIGIGLTGVFLLLCALDNGVTGFLNADTFPVELAYQKVGKYINLAFIGLCSLALLSIQMDLIKRHWRIMVLITAYSAILSIRGVLWDYYLIEPALVAVILIAYPLWSAGRWFNYVMVIGTLGCFVNFLALKAFIDTSEIKILAQEKMNRDKKVSSKNFVNPTYGYAGWKQFDCYNKEHEKEPFVMLSAFLFPKGEKLEIKYGEVKHPFVIERGTHKVLGFTMAFAVVDLRPDLPYQFDETCVPVLPLTDKEWKEYLDTP